MSSVNKMFGSLVKEKRKYANKSQNQLAESCGVSRASIANYEAGKQGISLEHAVIISSVLNISLDESLVKSTTPQEKG